MSNKKKKISAKSRRSKIEARYKNRASINYIRWNYSNAKKLDIQAIKNGTKIETEFKKFVIKRIKQKVKYIRKTYHVTEKESTEIIKIRKKNGGSFRKIVNEKFINIPDEPHFPLAPANNFLDIIDLIAQDWVLQNAKIEFNLWGELFETDKTGWNESIKIKIKRMLESYDSKDKKVYLILRQFLDVQQYKDANFKTYKIVINSVQKDVNETLESDE